MVCWNLLDFGAPEGRERPGLRFQGASCNHAGLASLFCPNLAARIRVVDAYRIGAKFETRGIATFGRHPELEVCGLSTFCTRCGRDCGEFRGDCLERYVD